MNGTPRRWELLGGGWKPYLGDVTAFNDVILKCLEKEEGSKMPLSWKSTFPTSILTTTYESTTTTQF